MSSLIFCTDETQALMATDTLATSYDGQPGYFTSKASILPHLRMMIAGTGTAGFLDRWFVVINASAVRGIDNLNEHSPGYLATMWSAYKLEIAIPDDLTTTVYHFGFSEKTGLIHSYAYRSATGFQSELLRYGTAQKPECSLPDDYRFPQDIEKMMDEQ